MVRGIERRPLRSRAWPVWAGIAVVALLAACQGHPAARPATPTPTAAPAPAGPRVAVVDFERVARAHPRWGDVDVLDRQIADLQGRLATPTLPQFQVPQLNLAPELQAAAQREVEQVRPQFQQQFTATATALRDSLRKEMDAYAAQVKAEQEATFQEKQTALQAQITKAVLDKQQAITQDNEQFQQQTLAQYRLQLLNLKLKLDAASDRPQQQALNQQIQALTKERDDKIGAHEKANQQAFAEFQQQQQDAYTQQIKDLEAQLTQEGQQKLEQKQAELQARLRQALEAKQTQLGAQMNTQVRAQLQAREQALMQGARDQLTRAQQQAVSAAQQQEQSLRAQLDGAQAERARLLASIMADVRVEAAELAQQDGYDVILAHAVTTVNVTDVTNELIARIKR